MNKCEYCNLEIRSDQNVLYSNESCLFLQLTEQEIKGSGIIVPKKHKETLFDLSKEEWNDTYLLLKEVKEYLDETFLPDGYNVGWSCGHVGGQHIFHAHMHVIPRFSGEPMAGKGIRYLFKNVTKIK